MSAACVRLPEAPITVTVTAPVVALSRLAAGSPPQVLRYAGKPPSGWTVTVQVIIPPSSTCNKDGVTVRVKLGCAMTGAATKRPAAQKASRPPGMQKPLRIILPSGTGPTRHPPHYAGHRRIARSPACASCTTALCSRSSGSWPPACDSSARRPAPLGWHPSPPYAWPR